MSAMTNNTIVTTTRRHKLVTASAGMITLPKIAGMAFGDGGVDEHLVPVSPTEDQTALTHEIFRKEIDGFTVVDDFTIKYLCTITTEDVENNHLAGKHISELALYDQSGDLCCIRTCTMKGIDTDIEQTHEVEDKF